MTTTLCQTVVKRTGKPCMRPPKGGSSCCGYHQKQQRRPSVPPPPPPPPPTEDGTTCCSICLCTVEKSDPVMDIVCAHVFHESCLYQWFLHNHQRTCPLCRTLLFDKPTKRSVADTLSRWERIGWTMVNIADEFVVGRPSQRRVETDGLMAILSVRTGDVIYL